MKAIIVNRPFEIAIEDRPKPEVKSENGVQIRITSGGICGSDIAIWNGTNVFAAYPRLIGHEFGGVVTEVGKAVTSVKPGDKVAVDPVISCGKCYACRVGRHNVCGTLKVLGVHTDGGFGEYVVVPESNVHLFHKPIDDQLLGLAEPYSIGMEICRRGMIGEGDQVLIMGSGPIGICGMQVAKMLGARVIMTDLVKERLVVAKKMGADETVFLPHENLAERIDAFTSGEGIPVVVDTVCRPSSFEEAVRMACPAGRVVCLGLATQPSAIPMVEITKKELTVVGSRLNNHCFGDVIAGIEAGDLRPDMLMTRSYPCEQAEEAFKLLTERPQEAVKLVLTF